MSFSIPKFNFTKILQEQTPLLKKIFEKFDKDKSGKLEAAEIEGVLKEKGLPADRAALVVRLSDKDGDGAISFEEFQESLNVLAEAKDDPRGAATKLFNELDADHSGYLDEKEVYNFLHYMNPEKATPEEAHKLVEKYDADKDGKLSLDETLKALHFE
ncbi:hypothetical protein M9Y10_003145 [Tritrichomonas musculus]|uniref:EF-hand domain-containing protein n=1 Tax=Tritrichomonas musculus TaxID=1915356 RepID=A0ABR2JP04_9EUKA